MLKLCKALRRIILKKSRKRADFVDLSLKDGKNWGNCVDFLNEIWYSEAVIIFVRRNEYVYYL